MIFLQFNISVVVFNIGNTNETHSDIDIPQYSISEASIELKQWDYSNSNSLHSLKSIASLESQCEDDTLEFMKRYVDILFENSALLTLELKSEFGLKSRVIYTFSHLIAANCLDQNSKFIISD